MKQRRRSKPQNPSPKICAPASGSRSAPYRCFRDPAAAKAYIAERGAPIVVKADGLAAGKGVAVATNLETALRAIDAALVEHRFGEAGREIVVEDFLEGEEASFFALVDGKDALPLVTAQDHKRLGEGDTGPNTGGMGAFSPAPAMTPALEGQVMDRIILPTIAAMRDQGRVFKGILYAGLMVTESGPMLLEYNVRFGDPEAQALMMRLISDPLPALIAAHDGILRQVDLRWHAHAALCVVMAARGYPDDPQRGSEIRGLDAAASDPAIKIFHAATRREPAPAHGSGQEPARGQAPAGARVSLPMAAASSASPRWAATSPMPATAPTPRSTGSNGPKASAAATSAAAGSDDSWLGRCGSAGREGDFDAAERAEIGADLGAVTGEDHASP